MKNIALIGTTALLVIIASSATAQIYKWVDENGRLHYTERPAPAGKKAESIEDKIRFAAALPTRNKTGSSYLPEKTSAGSPDPEDHKIKENLEKNEKINNEYQQQLSKYCDTQRGNLNTLQSDSPIAWEEDGKTDLLTNKQRQEKIKEIQQSISKNCSGSKDSKNSKKPVEN